MAAVGLCLLSCRNYQLQQEPVDSIAEYERVRANVYDAAITLCELALANDWEQLESVNPEVRKVVEKYRVPSLEYVLAFVEQMDNGVGCLSDVADEELADYDQALEEYRRIINRK